MTKANRTDVEMLGYTEEEIIGHSIWKFNDLIVITITHLDDLVEKGVLLGVCTDSYSVGQLAGEKAVKILKGGKPSSIPIESARKSNVILNMKTAKKSQFQIQANLGKTVTSTNKVN